MDALSAFLGLLNETLAAAIVVVAASMLLYNLSRNLRNRVARTSGVVLGCVTVIYVSDVLISLGPGLGTFESLLRFQWLGLAFIPSAMFHLSDALLATTGQPSRGRRRRMIRLLYGISTIYLMLATFTDWLILPERFDGRVTLQAGPIFPLYVLYFLIVNGVAFFNVQRARKRCLTRTTQRRMGYLQIAMLTPIIGIFPYSVLLSPGEEFTIRALILVNLANILMIMMLLLLAYPLSFFGSQVPDRVVKAELLRFMLRGPGTGLLALVVIIYTGPATQFLSVPGEAFMPFAVVAAILLWQWCVHVALPWLEWTLIYHEEDDEQLSKLQNLSERLLTRTDLAQLLEAILEATCDYLRVNGAFAAMLVGQTPELVKRVGIVRLAEDDLQAEATTLLDAFETADRNSLVPWRSYWLIPLYSGRVTDSLGQPSLIGLMGVQSRADEIDLNFDEEQMLYGFVQRTGRTLDDMLLQQEIYAALEGLLPQITITRTSAAEVEYRSGFGTLAPVAATLNREQVIEQVHAALRHYWGGPGLSSSRLLELYVVRAALAENDNNTVKALRAVLLEAIENQKPDGERDMKSPEWTLYNVLYLRFIESRKVRETARRLFMSEANLYRRQSVAIEAVAETLMEMERDAMTGQRQVLPG